MPLDTPPLSKILDPPLGLCRHAVSVCLSVRPSRSCILSKRINISSKTSSLVIATCLALIDSTYPMSFDRPKPYLTASSAIYVLVLSISDRIGADFHRAMEATAPGEKLLGAAL